MAEIRVLDSATIDKIAAGEVVERPSSVVKELVENAIDAGASAVTVEIKEGGISFIRVTDNGAGIERTQIENAFKRHATSKIRTVEDLIGVSSLGFRGEALSSISAVAQVELITKTQGELTGNRYTIEGGKAGELQEIGAPDGTTFLIRNLFFNTPPRRKFLKTAATEGGYIADLMEHMALSKPHISFQYIQNNQTRFQTSGNGDLKEVIYRVYGRDIARELLPVDAEMDGIAIHGFLGKPTINRSNRNYENYFVNDRYIKSNLVAKGIEEGYKAFLMQHKYPFTVLHFTVDGNQLDVNVHPTKMDIRFQNQLTFYDFLVRSISDVLHHRDLIPQVPIGKPQKEEKETKAPRGPEPFETRRLFDLKKEQAKVAEAAPYRAPEIKWEPKTQMKPEDSKKPTDASPLEESEKSVLPTIPSSPNTIETQPTSPENSVTQQPRILGSGGNDFFHRETLHHVIKKEEYVLAKEPEQLTMFSKELSPAPDKLSKEIRVLGQLFQTYWLMEYDEKLFIMDQHAAHEKIKYERLMKQFQEKDIMTQNLNPPVVLTLSGKEEMVLKQYLDNFAALGFEVELFGGSDYALYSVPLDLYGCDEKEMFLEILDELMETGAKGTPDVVSGKLATMACKAAVKGNMRMSVPEVEALLRELFTLENPYHCPHGRPTLISMTKYEIEKKFKRIL